MLNKINIKYLLIFSMSLMLIQIFIGTGVREFIDEQSKLYGRLDKDLWLSNPSFNFYFHRSFSILIFLVNGFLFIISKKINMSMKYINSVLILILLEIIIGIISIDLDGFIQVTMEDYLIQKNIMTHMQTQTTNILNQATRIQHQEEVKNQQKLLVMLEILAR